jgi:hypothetical protein
VSFWFCAWWGGVGWGGVVVVAGNVRAILACFWFGWLTTTEHFDDPEINEVAESEWRRYQRSLGTIGRGHGLLNDKPDVHENPKSKIPMTHSSKCHSSHLNLMVADMIISLLPPRTESPHCSDVQSIWESTAPLGLNVG